MKVAVESIGSYQRKIQVTVPADKVDKELDTAYKRLKGRVRLPGFRPGKAPRKVLEARFGQDIQGDVANNLIQVAYKEAVESEKLQPVGQPSLQDAGEIRAGKTFEFAVMVEVRPSVELTKFTGVEVNYPAAVVGDDELAAAVRQRLEGQAKLVEITDRAIEIGDMAIVELEIKDGKEVVATEPGTMIRTEADPYYPGIEAFLVGVKPGKSKKGKVTFGENARNAMVAGRELAVEAKVISVQANEIPELDDELAKELGHDSADAMRSSIAEQMGKSRSELARNQARANLLEALIEANPFDVPEGMIDDSLEMLMNELRLQQAYMGRDPRSLSFSDAQIADLRIRAAFASKAGLILEKVGEQEKITVTDADLTAKYDELAAERGQSVEAVKSYFSKPKQLEELKARMLEEMTLDWLLDRATIVHEDGSAPKKAAPKKADAKKADAKKADAKEEPKKAAPKKAAAKEAAAGADLSVLDGAVGKVKEAIDSGAHDAHLAELLAAEEGGKNRKGAVAAINARIAAI